MRIGPSRFVHDAWPVGAVGPYAPLIALAVPPEQICFFRNDKPYVIRAPRPFADSTLLTPSALHPGSSSNKITLFVGRLGRLGERRDPLGVAGPLDRISLKVLALRAGPTHIWREIASSGQRLKEPGQ